MRLNDFYNGIEFEAYEYLGAQVEEDGVLFRTYAPHAVSVSLIGEFNGWVDTPMQQVENGEFWECKVKEAKPGQMYKYRIYKEHGGFNDHADPYAFFSEKRPGTASVIYDRHAYKFQDDKWMWERRDRKNEPLNIYEMHMGSWRRKDDHEEHAARIDAAAEKGAGIDVSDGWYSYAEMAELIIPYLLEHKYNYLEIMPLNEYPADESWGYQSLGFFSVTSRYGDPDGLKALIEKCHENGIGVILDVVTVHFASNDYGLWQYDGTPVYEYPEAGNGRSEWGSINFNHSKGDVRSYLSSASEYWLKEYHFDGLRFDAVGNLIYWQGDAGRGENEIGINFLKGMNAGLKQRDGNVLLIAEDSSAYPNVTTPVSEGGLGFDYKWDMGWMNDTLNFFRTDANYRHNPSDYYKLPFSMQYFYNERYLLPLSHDEVVHGKATIMQKMYGLYGEKFEQGRALYAYMLTHPGKKLNFMGNEIGQLREWDEKKEQDWFLTKYPMHDSYQKFVDTVNEIYRDHSALWEMDYDRNGFEWLEADDPQQCVYVYRRRSSTEGLLCIFNMGAYGQTWRYNSGDEDLELLLDSDDVRFSGSTEKPQELVEVRDGGFNFEMRPYSARIYQEKPAGSSRIGKAKKSTASKKTGAAKKNTKK